MQWSSGVRTPRLDSWYSCEEVTGLRAARAPVAVRKRETAAQRLTGVEVQINSGDSVVRGQGKTLGGVPGAQAKLLRGLLGAVARWGGQHSAAQGI